jgi:uncharacterized membrane protein (UPF0182 family)
MSYELIDDAEIPPAQGVPGISAAQLRLARRWGLAFVALALLVLGLWWVRTIYTDWLWFDRLGLLSVYTKLLFLKTWLFLGGTLVAAAFLSGNLYLVVRFSRGPSTRHLKDDVIRSLRALIFGTAGLTVLIAGPIFGAVASGRWETFLIYFNRVPFDATDPQFGLDVSFYVATLRLLNFIQGWTLGLLITAIVACLALYSALYGLRGLGLVLAPRMMKHAAIMGLLLMLSIAAGHALDVYELVLSGKGVVFGATYTDVHARIPVLWLLTGIGILGAVGFGVSNYFGGLRLMAGSFSLWVIVVLLADLAYPALFQRFQVEPDEFSRELPYILRNLEATRTAYQLDLVDPVLYPATGTLDAPVLRANRATLDNIRLWDPQPLLDAYNQLQFMELYYRFLDLDSDRYVVDGRLRQVLVGARELDSQNLPPDAQNWVNRKLQYTHGYGVSMSPTTGFSPGEGRPQYFLQDIPIRGEFPVSRPELYYGESPANFAIVSSTMPEVNPSAGFQHYDGAGGVSLDSTLRRLAYAWEFSDINILLTDQINSDSRIQYRRQIRERVGAVAPFLKLDADPYPVLDGDGRIWWLQDTYTATDRYPYSARLDGELNYIRNSVKVAVDAYNGEVHFYVLDPDDPLLRMYRRAFPDLFEDLEAMPKDLRDHMRYPARLFSAQARTYLRYHVTDPQVFFNQAEQWAIPLETRFGKRGVEVAPSYLVLRMPEEEKEEFVLMVPFSPAGEKKNLVGWLVARSDPPNYGRLLGFEVPSDPQVDGPSQVEARIENDQRISQQFTLWEGAGSQIIRGQLLVIPVADAIIYVEPLYLQSEGLAFPELKKVILADSGNVVMADDIEQGLAMLVGGGPASPESSDPIQAVDGETPPGLEELDRIGEAVSGLDAAVDELEEALESLRETLGGTSK